MPPTRKELIEALEKKRGSALLCYVTGDRAGQVIQIGDDVLPCVAQHLGAIGKVKRLDLFMYSRGGNTLRNV